MNTDLRRIWSWNLERPIGDFPRLHQAIGEVVFGPQDVWAIHLEERIPISAEPALSTDSFVAYRVHVMVAEYGDIRCARFATKQDQDTFGRWLFDMDMRT